MNIVVLSGGLSTERNVSLTTGAKVQNALIANGHHAILADVFMGYKLSGSIEEEFKNATVPAKVEKVSELVPDLEAIKKSRGTNEDVFFGENIIELCSYADVVFMALHGENGENGRLQAAFDLLGIKYTGSGYLGCAVSMHKNLTKQMFKAFGVPTPQGRMVKKGEEVSFSQFGGKKVVVKPCCGGSSIGVYIADNEKDFKDALAKAFIFEDEILVEEYISGREFSVGVLGDTVLPAIEIIPKEGFYDYKNKYQADLTIEVCPANITKEQSDKMQNAALLAFKTLGLGGYARMDFLLDENDNIYCLEANSLPGMTPTSLLPQEAQAAGISYNELCEKIIALGLK
ncbi:MAG: D-alanine--D-alanine ligase [Clostridia bacterium]|nr:D-alanine--D-alanine ligase [Clostridia bacterium]